MDGTGSESWIMAGSKISDVVPVLRYYSITVYILNDRLCGLVVRVLDYRYSSPGFDSRALQKKLVGLERGALSLVSTN
jgi:hypothetical protein